jgi:tetratricopeptide (TPR) repeat protein
VDSERVGLVRQESTASRDAYTAGRDQIIIQVGATGSDETAAPGLLPRDVPGFTGRESELARLEGLVRDGSMVVVAIGGAAGVGKTALAVHAAHRLLSRFPGGHLYADLRGYTEGRPAAEPGEVLEMFLRRLGVAAEALPAGVEERSGLLRELLAKRRMLVVLDNAATEEQVRPLLPGAGGSLVLITSRSALAGLDLDARMDLDVLPDTEAADLLTKIIGLERAAAEPQALARIAQWCGCLPLALRIAGQLLTAHPAWQVAKLAVMLAGERDRLDRLSAGDRQVRAAFLVSYRQLPEPDARLFRLLGLHPGPNIDTYAAAALAGMEPEEAEPVLDRLALAHLITEDNAGWFGMHDLLRLFARQMCQDHDDQATRDAAVARLVGHFTELAEFLDGCLDPELRPAMAEAAAAAGESVPSLRQALETFEAYRPNMVAVLSLAVEHARHDEVERISISLFDRLNRLHHLDDLLTVTLAALTAAQMAEDKAAECRALTNLGTAHQELRRFDEAITCYQDALAICRNDADRHTESVALTCLGNTYQELRRFEEAVTCQQEALAICRETEDRHGEGMALGSLGHTYDRLRRFEEAVTCYQDALAIFRETGDQHREGMALSHLGDAYDGLGQFEEAITHYRDALAIFRETGDRHSESFALNNLGDTYRKLRRFEEALTCQQGALAILRETGDQHGEGAALSNLGDTYQSLRRFEEAVTCYQDALAILRETGDQNLEGATFSDLGDTFRKLRRLEEALTCQQDALAIFRETGDRRAEGIVLGALSLIYQDLGRSAEAAASRQDALTALQETGDYQAIAELEQDLNGARNHQRRRWLRRNPKS